MKMNDMVIISVDDHISEPPDMFDKHLSGANLASAPKLRASQDGTNFWEYQGMKVPSVGLNAVVGRPLEEYGMKPTSFEQLRKGVYEVNARIDDMNVNGVAASLNFGTAVGFDGGAFTGLRTRRRRSCTCARTTIGTSTNGVAPIANGPFPARVHLGHERHGGRDQAHRGEGVHGGLPQREPDQAGAAEHPQRLLGAHVEGHRGP